MGKIGRSPIDVVLPFERKFKGQQTFRVPPSICMMHRVFRMVFRYFMIKYRRPKEKETCNFYFSYFGVYVISLIVFGTRETTAQKKYQGVEIIRNKFWFGFLSKFPIAENECHRVVNKDLKKISERRK